MRAAGCGLMRPKVFLATVAQPNAKLLRDFVFLGFGELVVEVEGAIAFSSTGGIAMRIPQPFGRADSPTGFFNQRIAF